MGLILKIQKISSRTANNATLLNNTITCCHLDAMQIIIKQQCLGRLQHCKKKNVDHEAMQRGYLFVVLVHFLIVSLISVSEF